AGASDAISTASTPIERNVARSSASRDSFTARSSAVSFLLSRTRATCPVSGSTTGTTRPDTSGKLASQIGSWITTGTMSQRRDVAVGNELRGNVEDACLVEPRQRLARRGHRRTAVAEDDDARRLLRVVLADDELVRPACNRQARGARPVDLLHVVARPVRARAGDVRA